MDEKDLLPDLFLIWCKLQCIFTIFSDKRPCRLAEGLLRAQRLKEITDSMLITEI